MWSNLVSDDGIGAWPADPGLGIACEWASPRPFGVGTTRTVTLPTRLLLRERFFRWEEGWRHSLCVEAASRGGLTSFAEDYHIRERSGGCTLVWTVAIDPEPGLAGWLGPAALVNRFSLGRTVRAAERYFGTPTRPRMP